MLTASRTELKALLSLALPILGGQLAQSANGFVDTVMAGRVSANDLAAVAVGASIWVPLFLFMTGVLMSVTPILSRHMGGGLHQRITPLTQQAMWLAFMMGALGMLALRSMSPVMELMEVDISIRPIVSDYLQAISWGMPAAALWLALRAYTESMSHTRPVLWISVIGLLINIPCNYVLIYGKLGFPAMGGVGCGWATAFVLWLMALMMGLYIALHSAYEGVRLRMSERYWEPANLLYMLRLGLPVGLSIFFEVSIFSIIALFISQLGAQTVAGHQIALNFTALIFMLPLSLSLATTVRVGLARGAQDAERLKIAVRTSLQLSVAVGIGASIFLVASRHWIPVIYTDNTSLRELASFLLIFAAMYQISDAIQVWASGCLRGCEDTAWPMLLTLLSYWGLGLPVGYVLGMTDIWVPAMGPSGFWIGLVVGLTCAAVLLSVRLRSQMRRQMQA